MRDNGGVDCETPDDENDGTDRVAHSYRSNSRHSAFWTILPGSK